MPQLKHQQSPEWLAVIGDPLLMLIKQTRYVLWIKHSRATHPLRRQEVTGQRLQFLLEPFGNRNAEAFFATTRYKRGQQIIDGTFQNELGFPAAQFVVSGK